MTGLKADVVAVHEDWNGGAGNGLGTLYDFQKACAKAKAASGVDLQQKLHAGASVALYHTAGKGTRLAPLPGVALQLPREAREFGPLPRRTVSQRQRLDPSASSSDTCLTNL